MKTLFRFLIRLYQLLISPFIGSCCRFYPSCSDYALEAIEKYGPWKGIYRAFIRICKCHPFHQGGLDPP
ncbi:MAG TPA: membrane protein insertion efficiency factor YidD [Chlamydiales bacterium]|nr:membrane protein insertion efficiency factor YidD [Chlamydiales bacterium]